MPDPTYPTPSIGRIVHYRPANAKDSCAAVITQVYPEDCTVDLTVFPSIQLPYTLHRVAMTPEPTSGFWSWPPRAP